MAKEKLFIKVEDSELKEIINGFSKSTHLLNAVSPAWTSALAMANYVSKKFD